MIKLINSTFILFLILVAQQTISAQTYAYGNYTGNGVSKAITGLGFSPEAIIIKSNGAYEAVFRTSNMAAGKSKALGTNSVALASGQITSLDADGFTVGSGNSTNAAATQYNWIAFNESTNIHVGTYTGTGAAVTISGCGFQPEAALVCGDVASSHGNAGWLSAYMGAGSNEGFITYTTSTTAGQDFVNTYNADGWQTGNGGTTPCQNGTVYYYIAFNESGTTIKDNSYTPGNDGSDYAVTDPGFKPDFLIVKHQNATPMMRIASYSDGTDRSLYFTATAATTGHIKSMDAGAGFTVTNLSANVRVANNPHMYFAMSGGTSLPVQMTSFEAVKEGQDVILSWQTASEINSSYFDILHSTDGVNFEPIGKVDAAGNANHWSNYTFTHESPGDGIHYYQLSQYDNDGANEKFKVIAVNINSALNAITQLFPNPSSNNISLYYNSSSGGTYKLTINDINGNALYFAHIPSMIGENKFRLTVEPYEEGTYFINLTDPNGTVSSVKVQKRN
ncbi:MAG: T9SS type A sorting domain-containing protein [Bacteroidetes bacterium]|nr:T9SS type A sorting domain-containing protein [Bacteroidota bacterium]